MKHITKYLLIASSLAIATSASAVKYSIPPKASGTPTPTSQHHYVQSLTDCQNNLTTCQNNLIISGNNLTSCQNDLSTSGNNLTTCQSDLNAKSLFIDPTTCSGCSTTELDECKSERETLFLGITQLSAGRSRDVMSTIQDLTTSFNEYTLDLRNPEIDAVLKAKTEDELFDAMKNGVQYASLLIVEHAFLECSLTNSKSETIDMLTVTLKSLRDYASELDTVAGSTYETDRLNTAIRTVFP